MNEDSSHRVELYDFSVVSVQVSRVRTRPMQGLRRGVAAVRSCFESSPLAADSRIDQIGVFFTVTGAPRIETYDKGIQRDKKLGRMLMIEIVVPPWSLSEPDDAEFDEIAEAVVLVALRLAARRLGYDETLFATKLRARVATPRVAELFADFISPQA